MRKADFTEGNNYLVAVQGIILILAEADVFLLTSRIGNITRKFFNFYTNPGLVIFLPTCKYFQDQISEPAYLHNDIFLISLLLAHLFLHGGVRIFLHVFVVVICLHLSVCFKHYSSFHFISP